MTEEDFAAVLTAAKRTELWIEFLRLKKVMEDGSFENDLQTFDAQEMKCKYGDKNFSMMTSEWVAHVFGADYEFNLARATMRIRQIARIELGFPV
ncbi:MAG: hypothetical protein WAP03_08140 [Methylorubrum rhodinum]|uniref:hypothetical protein n=1 Tax=Methylorubrum rhodinum TaxID=29428 RepID=UPI003BAF5C7E